MNLQNTLLEDIAKRVLGKTDVTKQELETILYLDLGIIPTEMSVSAAETRQVRQYESNNYHSSITYNLNPAKDYIISELAKVPEKDKVEAYFGLKKIMWQMVSDKYTVTENYLRSLIQKQQLEDGIKR